MKLFPRGRGWWRLTLYPAAFFLLIALGAIYATSMPGHSYVGQLQPLTQDEVSIRDHLKSHVIALSGEIGERNLRRYDALERSAAFIESEFRALGLEVSHHEFLVDGKAVKTTLLRTHPIDSITNAWPEWLEDLSESSRAWLARTDPMIYCQRCNNPKCSQGPLDERKRCDRLHR